jgi:hypothetical protein
MLQNLDRSNLRKSKINYTKLFLKVSISISISISIFISALIINLLNLWCKAHDPSWPNSRSSLSIEGARPRTPSPLRSRATAPSSEFPPRSRATAPQVGFCLARRARPPSSEVPPRSRGSPPWVDVKFRLARGHPSTNDAPPIRFAWQEHLIPDLIINHLIARSVMSRLSVGLQLFLRNNVHCKVSIYWNHNSRG